VPVSTTSSHAFGTALKRARRNARLTQAQLAERAGFSVVYISMLERGARQPQSSTLALLADVLELSGAERIAFEAMAQASNAARGWTAQLSRQSAHFALGVDTDYAPLVGRSHEVSLIAKHLADERRPLLHFVGEPGIGKTRLLAEAAARASALGWRIIAGGGRRSGQEPYEPFVSALAYEVRQTAPSRRSIELNGCGWLARLLPELLTMGVAPTSSWMLSAAQERRLMFDAVTRYLKNLAGPSGTLLLLDDLHWAGADALDLLASLTRAASEEAEDSPPLRLIACYRDTEVDASHPAFTLFTDLAREGMTERVTLEPLSLDDAGALLSALLEGVDRIPADAHATLLQRTGGLPYFLVSCAQGLMAGAKEIPWDVRQSIQQRIAAVGSRAQELLCAAAVIGRVVNYAELAQILPWDVGELLKVLESVDRAKLLVALPRATQGGTPEYRFAHDLAREVVLADLSPGRQAVLNLAVAEMLHRLPPAERSRRAAELAYHFGEAGEPGQALPYVLQAGEQAQHAHAYIEAERHYRTAAELARATGDSAHEALALERLGDVEFSLVQSAATLDAYEMASNAYRASGDIAGLRRVQRRSAELLGAIGEMERGMALLRPLLDSPLNDEAAPEVASRFLALARLSTRPEERMAACQEAASLAHLAGNPMTQYAAELLRVQTLMEVYGRFGQAQTILDEILPPMELTGDLPRLNAGFSASANALLHCGDLIRAHIQVEKALESANQLGVVARTAFTLSNHGEVMYYLGDWDQAYTDFEQAVDLYETAEIKVGCAFACWGKAAVSLARGETEKGLHFLDEAMNKAIAEANAGLGFETLVWALATQAEYDLLTGDPETAQTRIESWIDILKERSGLAITLLPMLAWAYFAQGDIERATAFLQDAVSTGRGAPQHITLIEALRLLGVLAGAQERWSEAETALSEALVLSRGMSYPYAEAKVLLSTGLLALQCERSEEARKHLHAAREICVRLRERRYQGLIAQELANVGHSRIHGSTGQND
jgi:tetratricopeptide (TPR) repeat protein/transcriptional regulator with XRE-family HTH domain